MSRKTGVVIVAACLAVLSACVSADVYRVKEQEAHTLQRANQEILGQNRSLMAERTELQTHSAELKKEKEGLEELIGKQQAEILYLESRAAKLEKESEGLRERIEKMSVKIADLNRENVRLASLTRPENLLRTLGERLEDLQKQVENISSENQKLKTRHVAVRPDEGAEKGMPQAVAVRSGQKAVDDMPRPQQDERMQSAPTADRGLPEPGSVR